MNFINKLFLKENFKAEDEDVIAKGIGYPFDTLPKGFPNKISNKKIKETVDALLNNMKGNAGSSNMVITNSAFITLGLNELNHRENRRQVQIAFWFSIISILIALSALIFKK